MMTLKIGIEMSDFTKTYQLPFKSNIPNYIESHLKEVSKIMRMLKFYRRYLYVILNRQKKLEKFKILPEHKNILWINISAPSLGDSLMDLSSRVMLADRRVDLFTNIKNQHLYLEDEFFQNVFSKLEEFESINYDLIIIDSYSSRSIKIKSKIAPKVPYVGMFGYFNGPEVNRILFSFHKMNLLLGYQKSENEINRIAKNSISISKKDYDLVNKIIPYRFVAIVLGGEWKYKIYNNWEKVIDKIIFNNDRLKIIFLGSSNAKNISKKIIKQFPEHCFIDLVERLSYNQTIEVARRSKVLLCCDGGIMHGANAVGANSIVLFARLTPEMLTTSSTEIHQIFDKKNVNQIEYTEVLKKFYTAFNSTEENGE